MSTGAQGRNWVCLAVPGPGPTGARCTLTLPPPLPELHSAGPVWPHTQAETSLWSLQPVGDGEPWLWGRAVTAPAQGAAEAGCLCRVLMGEH